MLLSASNVISQLLYLLGTYVQTGALPKRTIKCDFSVFLFYILVPRKAKTQNYVQSLGVETPTTSLLRNSPILREVSVESVFKRYKKPTKFTKETSIKKI